MVIKRTKNFASIGWISKKKKAIKGVENQKVLNEWENRLKSGLSANQEEQEQQ